MKRYLVSLDVETAQMDLPELSKVLGIEADSGSQDIRTVCETRRVGGSSSCGHTVWRMFSEEARDATLATHVESVLAEFPLARIRDGSLPSDLVITLGIAVFFDTPMGSATLTSEHLRIVGEHGMQIEFSCYPCTGEE